MNECECWTLTERETKPDLMLLTCTASARSYGLYGPSILQTVSLDPGQSSPSLKQ